MFVVDVSQAKYFVQEVKEKTEKDIDVSTWEREFVEDLPEQENGLVFWSSANHNICLSFRGCLEELIYSLVRLILWHKYLCKCLEELMEIAYMTCP